MTRASHDENSRVVEKPYTTQILKYEPEPVYFCGSPSVG